MFWGSAFLVLVLSVLFKNHVINKDEASKSKPPRIFGMDVYPRRTEGDIKIPIWFVVLLFVFFGVLAYYG